MEHKNRIAVLVPTLGIQNRGAETFTMEVTNYLSQYYDIDIYALGNDNSVKSNIIQITCDEGVLLAWYKKQYQKSKQLRRLLNCSRWVLPLQPNHFFLRKFHRKVFKEYLQYKKYDVIFPVSGIYAAVRYRKHYRVPFFFKGGAA